MIIQFKGRAVSNRDELVKMVVATQPGTTVPVKILRNKQERTLNVTIDELDLEAEQGARASRNNNSQPPEEQGGGFGVTLSNLTPAIARRLQMPSGQSGALVTDVDPDGPAAGILRGGDVILSVNRRTVSSAADAGRELKNIASGRIAQILIWRGDGEVFVTIKKE